MTARGRTRSLPLTARWSFVAWRSKYRLRAKVVRTECGMFMGVTVTVLGLTLGLSWYPFPCGARDTWFRDFGHRFGRYTIGGWRTGQCVPMSTGWVFGGGRIPIGFLVTVASRTLMFAKLATRAQVRAHREHHGDVHGKADR
jgi:hypothetical protein